MRFVAAGRLFLLTLLALASLAVNVGAQNPPPGPFDQLRNRLIDDVLVPAGIENPRVLKASRDTPRHEFVAPAHRKNAYYDMALPIGEHQTISSPFIVAFMTQSLDPQPTDKVLEIGTGSGYQAAILSPLVKDVYSIEIVEPLGVQARTLLKRLKYDNVHVKIGDGFQGWAEHAPFDKIIVTCSPEKVPQPLVDQLAEGGMMIIPVGERYQQTLYLYRKKDGKLESQPLRPTLFVPMTGKAEASREVQPDPKNPRAINGNFELPPVSDKYVRGWYYEQQVELSSEGQVPEGKTYARFRNQESGRSSHILQGFAIDGRVVKEIRVSAWVKLLNVNQGAEREDLPNVAITFYDQNRKDLGLVWIGNFRGTRDWQQYSKTFRIPNGTREGILRVGLFGATGEACFDDIKIEVTDTAK